MSDNPSRDTTDQHIDAIETQEWLESLDGLEYAADEAEPGSSQLQAHELKLL